MRRIRSDQINIIDRTLEMTFDAPTNAEKHVTSNTACAHWQQNTEDPVF